MDTRDPLIAAFDVRYTETYEYLVISGLYLFPFVFRGFECIASVVVRKGAISFETSHVVGVRSASTLASHVLSYVRENAFDALKSTLAPLALHVETPSTNALVFKGEIGTVCVSSLNPLRFSYDPIDKLKRLTCSLPCRHRGL